MKLLLSLPGRTLAFRILPRKHIKKRLILKEILHISEYKNTRIRHALFHGVKILRKYIM